MNSNDTFQLSKGELLTRYNFNTWYIKIENALKARNLINYIEKDKLERIKNKIKLNNQNDKKYKRKLKKIEKKNAIVLDIIYRNITNEPFEFIKYEKNSFHAMNKLKRLYKQEKSFSVQSLINKLKELKANNLLECNNTLNQINEIFKLMESNNYKLSNQEKLGILYNSLPLEIQQTTPPTIDESPEKYYNKITKIISFKLYIGNNYKKENNIENNTMQNEPIINQANYATHNKKRKFCEICEKKGHTTKECWLNVKNKKSKFNKYYLIYLKEKKKEKKNEINEKSTTADFASAGYNNHYDKDDIDEFKQDDIIKGLMTDYNDPQ